MRVRTPSRRRSQFHCLKVRIAKENYCQGFPHIRKRAKYKKAFLPSFGRSFLKPPDFPFPFLGPFSLQKWRRRERRRRQRPRFLSLSNGGFFLLPLLHFCPSSFTSRTAVSPGRRRGRRYHAAFFPGGENVKWEEENAAFVVEVSVAPRGFLLGCCLREHLYEFSPG